MAKAENPQLSGKVFRFLSAMHPALSKAERKRYAGFDPDKWYPWTPEVSAEFTDLMRRSPRDTSFARGFAYVAQRAVPEGSYIPTTALLQHITALPAAFNSPDGTGFNAQLDKPGHATVSYSGMPGFANVCIAIQGELTQRLQASGAQSVVVKHGNSCRVNGADACEFEVEWSGETAPPETQPADLAVLVGEPIETPKSAPEAAPAEKEKPAAPAAAAPSAAAAGTQEVAAEAAPAAPPSKSAPAAAAATSSAVGEVEALAMTSGDELFNQLRKRLADADKQAKLFAEAQQEIDKLRIELSRVKAQADAEVAAARKERDEANESVVEFKRKINAVVSDD